jgi:hypothetical protein
MVFTEWKGYWILRFCGMCLNYGEGEMLGSEKVTNLHKVSNLPFEKVIGDRSLWFVSVLSDIVIEIREYSLRLTFLTPLVVSLDEQIKIAHSGQVVRDRSVWTNRITSTMLTIGS